LGGGERFSEKLEEMEKKNSQKREFGPLVKRTLMTVVAAVEEECMPRWVRAPLGRGRVW
jgi:hypothetical protein